MIGLLMSGGMDSISIGWWKRPAIAVFVDYGQMPATAERAAGAAACQAMGIPHETISADCASLGSGNMAGLPEAHVAPVPEWWPFRNQLILTLAGMAALRLGLTQLMIGTLSTDAEHADGRHDFVSGISDLMQMQEGELTVSAPAITMTAVDLVRTSGVPRDVLAWAHSCHIGDLACGQCRGCLKHYETWKALGWNPH